jgi:membrane-anchored glycerophosphoryl diester phosphodiesterase (GDPDase)
MTTRLPVGKMVLGAFLIPWWNRRAFGRALAIPLLLLVTLSLTWYYAGAYLPAYSNWLLLLLYGVLFAIFAVTSHRLVLLDPATVASRIYPRWERRETRFILWMVATWAIFGAIYMAAVSLTMTASNLWTNRPDENWMKWSLVVGKIPALYIFARLCLVFPATAVDRKVNLKWAWKLTKGNGWRLVLVVGVLPWIITLLINLLYGGDASTIETVALTFVGCALFAVEIAALSLSYRELTLEESPELS